MRESVSYLLFGRDADKGYQGAGRFTGREKKDEGAGKPRSPTGLVERYTGYHADRPLQKYGTTSGAGQISRLSWQ